MRLKPIVLTVTQPLALSTAPQILRNPASGDTFWAQRRLNSGKVNAWPFSFSPSPRGRPFGYKLSEENQERLDDARRAYYDNPDSLYWDED